VSAFLQQLVYGLSLGCVYALIALGYTMIYGVLKLLNFAHGDVYMVGAFIGYGVLSLAGGPAGVGVPVPLLLLGMVAAAALGCGVLGVAIERYAYRPVREASRVAPLITALGVSFFLQASMLLLFGARVRQYSADEFIDTGKGITVGSVHVSIVRILVVVAAVALMVALALVVKRTRLGKSMRAVAVDREAAEMVGIDVNRTIVAAFLIGSALAGVAGVMTGLMFSRTWHLMGFVAGLKGFTAAVVGGIGNIPGAMLGGVLIGVSEAMVTSYVSSTFTNLIVFGLLIAVMLVRPSGLLGRAEIARG
jgi:branched-chain amino acid transport system permease protein